MICSRCGPDRPSANLPESAPCKVLLAWSLHDHFAANGWLAISWIELHHALLLSTHQPRV